MAASSMETEAPPDHARGSPLEVFLVFLGLGLTSFGGPIAHLGYFRRAFVERRGWLEEAAFADIIALCQFLPGPASSQVGYAVGLTRAGFWGGVAAWTGFTAPSAALMTAFAYAAPHVSGGLGDAVMHGLTLMAVAVVAQAVLAMARSLCTDRRTSSIAAGAALIVIAAPVAVGQLVAIAAGALAGFMFCRGAGEIAPNAGAARPATGLLVAGLILFALLFAPGGAVLRDAPAAALFHAFYKSGALVFGGGHVVLPLLREQMVAPGWVSDRAFLAGYGAAQAMPGPLFTFAAYLGAIAKAGGSGGGVGGAAIALGAIFLPGLILVSALLPHWRRLRHWAAAQAVMRGVNASVVGILGMAFYNPVWTNGVRAPADLGIALVAFVLLAAWRAPPLLVVMACVAASVGLTIL
jgi:chromate transporter